MQRSILRIPSKIPAVPSLNSANLKAAASFFMFFDHAACGVFWTALEDKYPLCSPEWLRLILRLSGRASFPVFCFFLVEGFVLTGNKRNYFLRMLAFALISEIPFNLCMNGTLAFPRHQNVLFTMALGLLLMSACDLMKSKISDPFEQLVYCLALGFFFGIMATALRLDYKLPGIILISILYMFRESRLKQFILGYVSFVWEPTSAIGFLLLLLYNGQRGKQGKYFFYVFYPFHLLLIFCLSLTLSPA